MLKLTRTHGIGLLTLGALTLAAANGALAGDHSAGLVRIHDAGPATTYTMHAYGSSNWKPGRPGRHHHGEWCNHRPQHRPPATLRKLFCWLNYFNWDGCCGQGCPPFGKYHMVYPVDPYHFDQRDGRVYSAQGYGVPMAVPLPANVRHTYNYGWGIPSSRLTPVSRPARRTGVGKPAHW